MVYIDDWLSREDLIAWAEKNFPEVKIKSRKDTNNYAEARLKSDGTLLAFCTSNRALKNFMDEETFARILKVKKSQFGFETATFEGDGY